jgi:hypothetical protein
MHILFIKNANKKIVDSVRQNSLTFYLQKKSWTF